VHWPQFRAARAFNAAHHRRSPKAQPKRRTGVERTMLRLILILLVLAVSVTDSDARRKRDRDRDASISELFGFEEDEPRSSRKRGRESFALGDPDMRDDSMRLLARLLPSGWTLQPPDPNWKGHRFVAPGGDAWLALYNSTADKDSLDKHLKTVAFVDGEELMFLQRGRDRLMVAGHKGERNFFRKVVLDCDGRQWQHVAIEYPAEARRAFGRFIPRIAKLLDVSAGQCGPLAAER
jgi:hypothetical protein